MADLKVLGIGAWDRSGSTILANVLGSVPGVVSVGELNNLWERGVKEDRPCACGERFSNCEFWVPIMEDAFGDPTGRQLLDATIQAHDQLGNLSLIKHRITGRRDTATKTYAAGMDRLYRSISLRSGADVIVDSAKKPWHLAIADQASETAAYALHLVRDPRGVAHSLRKRMAYDPDAERPADLDRLGTTFTALGWRYRNTILATLRSDETRYKRLHYEEFVRDPRATIISILDWLDHPHTDLPFTESDRVQLEVNHSVSGNPVRFQKGTVRIDLDDAWLQELGRGRRLWVDILTWPMLTRYGYHP